MSSWGHLSSPTRDVRPKGNEQDSEKGKETVSGVRAGAAVYEGGAGPVAVSPDERWASDSAGSVFPAQSGSVLRHHSSSAASSCTGTSSANNDNGWSVNDAAIGPSGMLRPHMSSNLVSDRRKPTILFGPGAIGWGKVSEAPLGDLLITGESGVCDGVDNSEEDASLEEETSAFSNGKRQEGCHNRRMLQSGIAPTPYLTKQSSTSPLAETSVKSEGNVLRNRMVSFKTMMDIRADSMGVIRKRRRTKIVCAIGPVSRSVEMIMQLLAAGMNIARLNFSHGDHAYHLETFRNIKTAVARQQANGHQCHCAILMDTKGPEIRTGFLKNHEPVMLRIHQELEITTDYSIEGDSTRISCSYEHLCSSAYVGGTILIADGSISCKVTFVGETSVSCRVENNAILGERKNMNIPGVTIRLAGITEKDKYDIEHFALKYDVDIVSGSFIRTAANVRSLRECLKDKGRKIRVHAKIESIEGLRNLDDILAEADGVHVSRGDLGMELPLSKLFLAQKTIINRANIAGKPVVTSTQMLDSMTVKPRPTNAECSDVANAVLDGTDVVMLSAETANGRYPKESVETMARIIAEAEVVLDYDGHFSAMRDVVLKQAHGHHLSIIEALASSAVESAIDTDAPLIVLMSETGQLALMVAKYRPPARILVVTGNPMTARQMSASRGLTALLLEPDHSYIQPPDAWPPIARYVAQKGWADIGDRVVLVSSPLDSNDYLTLNQTGDGHKHFKSQKRSINCLEIRVIHCLPSFVRKLPL